MIMVHGFSDHIGRYYEFFPSLAKAGIAVYGFDQRGWGRSVKTSAQRGLCGPTRTVLSDIAAFVRAQLPAEVPIFLCGHSMGGGEVLTLASSSEYDELIAQIRGFILEAPFIAFAKEQQPSWIEVNAGKLAAKILPRFHLTKVIPPENVSRDPAVQESIRDDKLLHDTGTLEGLSDMLDRTDGLSGGRFKLRPGVRSLLLLHGDADKVCSYESVAEWYERETKAVQDKAFRTYEGMYHQLHADYGKEKIYADVVEWLLERCPEGQAVGGSVEADVAPTETETESIRKGEGEGETATIETRTTGQGTAKL
jgi:acylglycerol lipase